MQLNHDKGIQKYSTMMLDGWQSEIRIYSPSMTTLKGCVDMPRKGENIYKRKDGRWEARYVHHYENGKAKYRYLYGKSYKEAKLKRQAEITKSETVGVSIVKRFAMFDEVCGMWLLSRKQSVKESTFTRYFRIVDRYLLPELGGLEILSINSDAVNRMSQALGSNLSAKTVSDIMCVFKSIWKYGRDNDYPCNELDLSKNKVKSTHEITVISPAARIQIEQALFQHRNRVSMGIIFALFTGVRIGELCGLKWGDIDFENGYSYIRRTVERIADLDESTPNKTKVIISEPKTENSLRIIPLPSFLLEYIKSYRLSNDRYILTGSVKHTEPHSYYMRYKTFLNKYNLGDYTFHELRHSFATQCVDRGFDIKSLSEILGHSNVNTTMNLYVHPTLQMKKRQMDTLAPVCYSSSI